MLELRVTIDGDTVAKDLVEFLARSTCACFGLDKRFKRVAVAVEPFFAQVSGHRRDDASRDSPVTLNEHKDVNVAFAVGFTTGDTAKDENAEYVRDCICLFDCGVDPFNERSNRCVILNLWNPENRSSFCSRAGLIETYLRCVVCRTCTISRASRNSTARQTVDRLRSVISLNSLSVNSDWCASMRWRTTSSAARNRNTLVSPRGSTGTQIFIPCSVFSDTI